MFAFLNQWRSGWEAGSYKRVSVGRLLRFANGASTIREGSKV